MLGKVFEGPLESRHKHSGALMFRRQDDIKDTYVRVICTHMWNFKRQVRIPKQRLESIDSIHVCIYVPVKGIYLFLSCLSRNLTGDHYANDIQRFLNGESHRSHVFSPQRLRGQSGLKSAMRESFLIKLILCFVIWTLMHFCRDQWWKNRSLF